MKTVLEKLYQKDEKNLMNEILYNYEHNSSVVVNFVYFSLVVAHKLFIDGSSISTWNKNIKKTVIQKNYRKALLKWDFLLPDGIALQIFNFLAKIFWKNKKWVYWLSNLNGTDFVPHFLEQVKKKYWPHSLCISLYGAEEKYLEKTKKYLQSQWYNIVYSQDGFSEFDWKKCEFAYHDYHDTVNVLLVAMTTPTNPIQELWTMKNFTKIKNNKFLVMNVWGLFDFWAGAQKRAPLWIRKLKLEWLYRLFSDPKRNFKKVKNSFMIFPYIFKYLLLKK